MKKPLLSKHLLLVTGIEACSVGSVVGVANSVVDVLTGNRHFRRDLRGLLIVHAECREVWKEMVDNFVSILEIAVISHFIAPNGFL